MICYREANREEAQMSEISAAARPELVQAVGERYRQGTTAAKRRILDEFVALPGTTGSTRSGCSTV